MDLLQVVRPPAVHARPLHHGTPGARNGFPKRGQKLRDDAKPSQLGEQPPGPRLRARRPRRPHDQARADDGVDRGRPALG